MESNIIESLPESKENLKNFVYLENPMWPEKDVMRTTLMLGLIESAKRNVNRGITDVRLFEMGTVFFSPNIEKVYLSGIIMGSILRKWHNPGRRYDFYDIKGGMETILRYHGVDFTFTRQDYPLFENRVSLGIITNNRIIGYLGKIDKGILDRYDTFNAYGFEIDIDELMAVKTTMSHINFPPRYPSIRRDISLIIDKDTESDFVLNLILNMNIPILEGIKVIDYYTGKNIPQGKKSFTYSLVFRAADRTLKDTEVDDIMEKIFDLLEEKHIEVRSQ